MRRFVTLVSVLLTMLVASGCAGSEQTAGSVPESARLAPADAVAFASLTADRGSSQWQQAEAVLDRIPGLRDQVVGALERELADEGLDWEEDVAPALGSEVVAVVTANRRPIVLVDPESDEKLDELLATFEETVVKGDVEDRVALAGGEADLEAYRVALAKGTIEDDPAFVSGMEALPSDRLGAVWVDVAVLTEELDSAFGQEVPKELDLGLEWLSAALAAQDDGLLVAMGTRTPGGGDTSYDPELFQRVPDDAVLALSFGGTQGTFDKVQDQVDEVAGAIEKATGISIDGLFEALSGEGVLYVRPGEELPEVTLALAPPDPDETWRTIDRLVRKLAAESDVTVATATEAGIEVSSISVEGVTVKYARVDSDTIVVTTSDDVASIASDGPKLADTDEFQRAAEDVGLEGRTKGFVYLDVDGLVPLVEDVAGSNVPDDAREGLNAVDTLILQADGEGDATRLRGFVRIDD